MFSVASGAGAAQQSVRCRMNKPPISIFIPSYVVEYAVVDSTVKFMNRKNLNVGGNWLGAVPKLAICKNLETSEYHLSHCDDEWNDLCAVQTAKTIQEIKEIAEKHYQGIGKNWVTSGYSETDAIASLNEEIETTKCSFCGRSPHDESTRSMIVSDNARICDVCIREFYHEIQNMSGRTHR